MNKVLPLPSVIALRYLRSKKTDRSISFFSMASLIGLSLGLASIIVVVSVMNGFEKEMHKRMLNMLPHVSVENLPAGKSEHAPIQIETWLEVALPALEDGLFANDIESASPYVHLDGLINKNSLVKGVRLVGILPGYETQTSVVDEFLQAGSLELLEEGSARIILGSDIARELGIIVGDEIGLIFPELDERSKRLKANSAQFKVVGFFDLGTEADGALAFVPIADAAMLKYGDRTIDGFRYRLRDVYQAEYLQGPLEEYFSGQYQMDTWVSTYGQLFQTVKIEKVMTASMLMLIVLVAAFNTVSSLSMLVLEKHTSIAVLRTMGFTRLQVLLIFFYQGMIISSLGLIIGVVTGVAISLNLEPLIYWVNDLGWFWIAPLQSVLMWSDVFWIALGAWCISMVSSIVPALNATKVQPADAVRYH